MKIGKKQKIYGSVLGAALVAWGVDAMFFESPETPNREVASAAVAPRAQAAPEPVSSTAVPVVAQEDSNQWLGSRLRDWSEKNPDATNQVRDIFSPPASWIPQKPAAPPPAPGKVAEDFRRDHHLTAVVLGASGGSAVIDGRLLHIGQTVGGCRLKAVSSGCADLLGPDGREFRVLIGPEDDKNVK
jgi:hypothetical protein